MTAPILLAEIKPNLSTLHSHWWMIQTLVFHLLTVQSAVWHSGGNIFLLNCSLILQIFSEFQASSIEEWLFK